MGSTGQEFDAPRLQGDLPYGEILRQSRVHYGLSLTDVESALRIRASQLEALEQGRADKLPGRVYAIGFVRAYAEYLGLDGNQMVHLFKTQAGGVQGAKPELHFPVSAAESKLPNLYVLAGSFAAVILVIAAFIFLGGGNESAPEIPAVTAAIEKKEGMLVTGQAPLEVAVLAAIETASGTEGPSTFVKPQSRITINVTDSVWVEIRNAGGKAVLSRIMKPGDSYLVPDEDGMTLSTGNAGGLSLVIDGAPPVMLGAKGEILRGTAVAPETLAPTPAETATLPAAEE